VFTAPQVEMAVIFYIITSITTVKIKATDY